MTHFQHRSGPFNVVALWRLCRILLALAHLLMTWLCIETALKHKHKFETETDSDRVHNIHLWAAVVMSQLWQTCCHHRLHSPANENSKKQPNQNSITKLTCSKLATNAHLVRICLEDGLPWADIYGFICSNIKIIMKKNECAFCSYMF